MTKDLEEHIEFVDLQRVKLESIVYRTGKTAEEVIAEQNVPMPAQDLINLYRLVLLLAREVRELSEPGR